MVKDTATQSSTSNLREFNPSADRSLYQQRIVDAIFAEFETHEMYQEEFCEAMWIALQIICGPQVAASFIVRS
ncbi:hypothetical protein [Citrobacter sp. AATXR]|uniref:hypothetical protein n=1 Tax=Citrobacter sp. AATXR TaxID=1779183 RepID=UPI000778943F|nr:hypothetical protein [Citrobacter sp. AATXR]KYC24087.1 hypothetical protein WM45_00120 [Citrobacter sp. AATXR]